MTDTRQRYLAHSPPKGFPDRWEDLGLHLRNVAERAAAFAAFFGASEEARLAGLLHDLGKYAESFLLRLRGEGSGLDHWSAGAWAALQVLQGNGGAAGLAILGHHVGLQDLDRMSRVLDPVRLAQSFPPGRSLTDPDFPKLLHRFEADGLSCPEVASSLFDLHSPRGSGMLDVRMLFSALVDADYLETEAHFQGDAAGPRRRAPGPDLQPERALELVRSRLAELARESRSAEDVDALRRDLAEACLASAEMPPGVFTLSAPTGAGKTLAMLAFALRHAARHGLRRVVIAVPYLSIIEQTVDVYRAIFSPHFGPDYVLEHHSLAGARPAPAETDGGAVRLGDEQDEAAGRARLLAENWDAPLVVTTSVQILESLFANRPAPCRKLHRLSRSVLLFDEVQTLPLHLAVPTLATLSHLTSPRFGSSVVFATATQPAFPSLAERVTNLSASGWAPQEIAPKELGLFGRLDRVAFRFDLGSKRSWDDLAAELARHPQALCIVNLKRHARSLLEALRRRGASDLFHLSTHLCPAHRREVLTRVRERVGPGRSAPCLLVSTQCVEAGVDLDFPVVFRALAPLEAIAQAAGRCNRNGRRPEKGLVVVFEPEDEGSPGADYDRATTVARVYLLSDEEARTDPQAPAVFERYYRKLYGLSGLTSGAMTKEKALGEAIHQRNFEEVAKLFRLIDADAISVLVPYDPEAFAALRRRLEVEGRLSREWIRDARPHTVSLYRPKPGEPILAALDAVPLGRGPEQSQEWFVLQAPHLYDEQLGLKMEEPFLQA